MIKGLIGTAAISLSSMAGCQPFVNNGTHTDPKPCAEVWVDYGQKVTDTQGCLDGRAELNVIGMPADECDHSGGRVEEWGCRDIDY